MINKITFLLFILFSIGCNKDITKTSECDIQKIYAFNAAKVSIANGVWGTVSFAEGNCMPGPGTSNCKNCPVKRTVRFYEYTLRSQAKPSGTSAAFYNSFSTQIIKELNTDENGFFQTDLPPGQYTMVVLEDGKLYANGIDSQGGINPFTYSGGKRNINFTLNYKAAY